MRSFLIIGRDVQHGQEPNAKAYVNPSKGIKFSDVADEANVPFFSVAGSEFVEMFVGMGVSKVRVSLNKHSHVFQLVRLYPKGI